MNIETKSKLREKPGIIASENEPGNIQENISSQRDPRTRLIYNQSVTPTSTVYVMEARTAQHATTFLSNKLETKILLHQKFS